MLDRVTDAVSLHARQRGAALAAAQDDRCCTWRELDEAMHALAAALAGRGLQPGDRVALLAADGLPALAALLAVLAAGAVHVPIDHQLAPGEVAALIAATGAQWVLERDGAPGAGGLADALGSLAGWRWQATGEARGPDPLGAGASAVIRFSSGTTAAAKGVVISHATIRERCAAANQGLGLSAADRVLWLLPMAYHVVVSVLLYVQVGAGLIFGQALRASTTARIARRHATTVIYTSPYHVRRLADLLPGEDLPASLRCVVATTAALDADGAARFRRRHGIGVRQGLGIIEVGLPFLSPGAENEAVGAFDAPLPAYQSRILAADGTPLPAGTPGQLAIAGPGICDAYLNPWQSRAALLRDGFFPTGDLAVLDAEGRLRLLGRLSDAIPVGGHKVFPVDVEAVLGAHPQVGACRVRGVADARLGQVVHADVEPTTDSAASAGFEDRLRSWCAERLAPLAQPASYRIWACLPRTATGKISRWRQPAGEAPSGEAG